MKKLLVFVALAALCSTSAFAGIANTKHDLSSGSSNTIKGNSNEICVYCHTPHGASATAGAPLWNRTPNSATGSVYAGVDLQTTQSLAGINASDAVLCLSCHDGTTVGGALNNPPNSLGGTALTIASGDLSGLDSDIGQDLSNDHPVGFTYPTTAIDTEIKIASVVTAAGLKVDYNGDQMWCSSCHDVHNNTNAPFLAKSNAGSALCLTCHSK